MATVADVRKAKRVMRIRPATFVASTVASSSSVDS
jgi:hypothetical protein